MIFGKSLYERIFYVEDQTFDDLALDVFRYQYDYNPLYRSFVDHLGRKRNEIDAVAQIPFLPIEFFKRHKIQSGSWNPQKYYESSGTTGQVTSKHYVADEEFYLKMAVSIFEKRYGKIEDFTVLALLPSYLERGNSSLVAMAQRFIEISEDDRSGFFLNDFDKLAETLKSCEAEGKKTLLLGVTFGLLDFVDEFAFPFPELMVMETGGMKGRKEEMVRSEVHDVLKAAFQVDAIHSEYGMTELFSQAYAPKDGIFFSGKSMKVLLRDINDPLFLSDTLKSGGMNIIDLANVDTCSFIETKDIGKTHSTGGFEVLGRMDNSDIRGCNLMVL